MSRPTAALRRRHLLGAVAATLAAAPGLHAWAQGPASGAGRNLVGPAWPVRPVRLIVPFPPGTSPDVMARLWGERFARLAGQPVVVENKPGAATLIAAQAAAAAPPDGHTLFWTVNNTFSINPHLYAKLPYSVDDFVPVTRVLSVPFVLLVSAESRLRSLDDLVAAARAAPGQLHYASPGIGTAPHVVMARLLTMAGVSMNHVPYKDAYLNDVIAQRVDAAFDASTTAIAQVRGGKVRALGLSGSTRIDALKEVAPIGERYPGFVGESWHGLFAPRGTPEPVVATLAEHAQAILAAPEFRQSLAGYGLVPAGGSPAAFRQFLAEDSRAWGQVIRQNRITLE